MPSTYYEFVFMRLQNGSQVSRMQNWLEKRAMPIFQKNGLGTVGYFNMEVSAYSPAILGVYSYPSLAAMEATWGRLTADPDFAAALAENEQDQPALYREDTMLLRATPFSPPFNPPRPVALPTRFSNCASMRHLPSANSDLARPLCRRRN